MDSPLSLASALERLRLDPDDEPAWEEMYRRLRPYVLATTYRYLGGAPGLTEDVTQEAFAKLWLTRPYRTIPNEHALRAYLRTVAVRIALDYLRRAMSRERHEADWLEAEWRDPQGHPAQQAVAESRLLSREAVEQATRTMPEVDRQIMELVTDGRSLAEISGVTGLSYSNVGVRLHRLRTKLRKLLQTR